MRPQTPTTPVLQRGYVPVLVMPSTWAIGGMAFLNGLEFGRADCSQILQTCDTNRHYLCDDMG